MPTRPGSPSSPPVSPPPIEGASGENRTGLWQQPDTAPNLRLPPALHGAAGQASRQHMRELAGRYRGRAELPPAPASRNPASIPVAQLSPRGSGTPPASPPIPISPDSLIDRMRNLSLAQTAPRDSWLDALDELSQGGDTAYVTSAGERSRRFSTDIEQEWHARFPARAPRPGAQAALETISPSGDASTRAASDPDSDSEDDFRVIIEDEPNTRTNRLDRLAARVAEAASPADVDALAGEAGQVRGLAEADHSIARLRDFSTEFTPGFANHITRFHLLRLDAEWLNEAGRAWEAASDHYRAAATAAAKFDLPPGRVGPLEAAADECEARALRQDLKRDLIQAVLLFRRYWQQFNTGHARILEAILASLRSALERCRSPELAALPLQAEPIDSFNRVLRDIGESARWLREAVLQSDPQVTGFARMTLEKRTAWAVNAQRQTGELTELAGQLLRALRGEAPPEAATPAPPPLAPAVPIVIETVPAAADPHAPLRAALVAELGPMLDRADQSEAATRVLPNETGLEKTVSIKAWHTTARAYDDAAQAFDQHVEGAADAIFDDPAVRELHERIVDGRRAAFAHLRFSLEHRFSELWQSSRSALEETEKMVESGDNPERVRSGVQSCGKIAEYTGALCAWGAGSNLLRRAPGMDADRLMAPFAALAQFLEAIVSPIDTPSETLAVAEGMRQAIDIAVEASRGANTGLAATLRNFLDYARQARMTAIGTATAMEADESSALYHALEEELTVLQRRAIKTLIALPGLLSEPPAEGSAPADDEASIASARAARARVDRRRGETAVFPPDTPASHVQVLCTWSAALKESAAGFEASAGILTLCGEVKEALETAEPSRRPQVLRRFAERAREIGVQAARTSTEQTLRNMDAHDQGHANALLGIYTRRNERLAEYMRYVLNTLGPVFEFPAKLNRVLASNRGDEAGYLAAQVTLSGLQQSIVRLVDEPFLRFRERIQSDKNIQIDANDQPNLVRSVNNESANLINIFTPLKWRAIHELNSGYRAAIDVTLNGLMSRIPAGRRPAIDDGLRLLNFMEVHLKVLSDSARQFVTEMGNRDRFATEVAANVALGQRVQEARKRLRERKAELEAARGGGSAGATSSRARQETPAPASRPPQPPEPGQSAESSRPAQPQSNRGRRKRR